VITRIPTEAQASWITSSDPSMADGEAWWSMIVVVPASTASSAPSIADQRIISRSRAASRRHHTNSRISPKLAGVRGGAGIPRARAE
jgi:hypothetical protein